MGLEENKFQQVLSAVIHKERQAYQRATLLTAIPIIVGVLVFSFFTYRVVKLRYESAALDQEIQDKTKQLNEVRVSLDVARDESANNALKADKGEQALEKIARGTVDPKKQAAETLRAIASPTPAVKASPGSSPNPTPSKATGFIGSSYRGHNKTVITVEVTARETRLAFTYDLDGKVGALNDKSSVFRFTLDKSKHDPSRLFMFFDFYSDKDGVYDVRITAGDGSVFNMTVPQGTQSTRTRVLYFDVM